MIPEDQDVILQIVLRYQSKNYLCETFAWLEDKIGGTGKEWVSGSEDDSVRNCEHDYACLLGDVVGDKDFGCDQKEIEVIDYWFYNRKTKKKVNKF